MDAAQKLLGVAGAHGATQPTPTKFTYEEILPSRWSFSRKTYVITVQGKTAENTQEKIQVNVKASNANEAKKIADVMSLAIQQTLENREKNQSTLEIIKGITITKENFNTGSDKTNRKLATQAQKTIGEIKKIEVVSSLGGKQSLFFSNMKKDITQNCTKRVIEERSYLPQPPVVKKQAAAPKRKAPSLPPAARRATPQPTQQTQASRPLPNLIEEETPPPPSLRPPPPAREPPPRPRTAARTQQAPPQQAPVASASAQLNVASPAKAPDLNASLKEHAQFIKNARNEFYVPRITQKQIQAHFNDYNRDVLAHLRGAGAETIRQARQIKQAYQILL